MLDIVDYPVFKKCACVEPEQKRKEMCVGCRLTLCFTTVKQGGVLVIRIIFFV